MQTPYLFDEFFASGMEESVSPFLTPKSRSFGANLSLKSSGSAAFLLALAFAFSFHIPPVSHLLLSLVYFLVGIPALIAAISDLRNLEINIDILMTLAAFISIFLDSALEGALLLVLFELSHGMEHAVSKKAKSALHNLSQIAPKFAIVIEEGIFYEKAVREIAVGQKLFIKHGEIVPLDGKVVSGKSSVSLVHLTGESLPVPKKIGDTVPAGARNLESALTIEVERTSSDSTLSHIIELITKAHSAKPRLQRWLDHFGKRYASFVIGLTFLFAVSFPLFLNMTYLGHEGAVYRALAFLIAASPCALIIATPTAYLSAISSCAKKGILLKGGLSLDALAQCQAIAFDKTGTLTTGKLVCKAIEPIGKETTLSQEIALSIAYGMERQVVHPIATAISDFAISQKIQPAEIASFKAIPGTGLEGVFQGQETFIGLLDRLPPNLRDKIHRLPGEVLSILIVGEDSFLFRFTDEIRKASFSLIQNIQTINRLTPIMLTGDHFENAKKIGELLKIPTIYADLRPEDKLAKVAALTSQGGLAMVGDGINDAPALARATVGISMGKIGSATAVDASDVVLLNDDLELLSWLFSKAKQTLQIVKQNLSLALAVITFATIPALLGLIPLWAAVILHEGGTVLVGLNSLRLLRK